MKVKTRGRRTLEKRRQRRNAILERDRFACLYCLRVPPRSELTIDHVVPRHQGGLTQPQNLCAACTTCNRRKRNYTIHEWVVRDATYVSKLPGVTSCDDLSALRHRLLVAAHAPAHGW